MSTSVRASQVFALPIDFVWRELRDFTFPVRLLPSQIADCKLVGAVADGRSKDIGVQNLTGTTVGAIREIRWKQSDETRKSRLLCVDDRFFRVEWELLESSRASEVTAQVSTINLYTITSHNHTLVTWNEEFSSDVKGDLIRFHRQSLQQNLQEIANKLQELFNKEQQQRKT